MRPVLERLRPDHFTTEFDCGDPEMNLWLRERALLNQASGYSCVHVLVAENKNVIGFFSLSSYTIHLSKLDHASQREHVHCPGNVPAVLIGKLARDVSVRDKKVGSYLLKQALIKATEIADVGLGCVYVAVEAEEIRVPWYQEHDFIRASATSKLLYLPLIDVKAEIEQLPQQIEPSPANIGDQEKVVP